jgi:hypothetical protein
MFKNSGAMLNMGQQSIPRRLKPYCFLEIYGGTEVPPLQNIPSINGF